MLENYVIELDEDCCQFDVLVKNTRELIGRLAFWLKASYLEVADLYLDDSHRQKGIGSELMLKVIQLAKCKGYGQIKLSTQADDYPVHEFYKKHGFRLDRIEQGGAKFILDFN